METETERLKRELREAEERYREALEQFNRHWPVTRWLAKGIGNLIAARAERKN